MIINSYKCPICKSEAVSDLIKLNNYTIYACKFCSHRFAPDAFGTDVNYNDVHESINYRECQEMDLKASLNNINSLINHPTYLPFFRNVHLDGQMRLLDVGCGVGRFCHAAASKGFIVTGIDISSKAIETSGKYASFPMMNFNIDNVIETHESYNIVTAFEVLEHCISPLELIIKIKQVLIPGGHVFFTVPNWNCYEVRNSSRSDWTPPIHLQFFTKRSLLLLGQHTGLRNIKIGVITTDPLRYGFSFKLRWIIGRILNGSNIPLGLWMHARI